MDIRTYCAARRPRNDSSSPDGFALAKLSLRHSTARGISRSALLGVLVSYINPKESINQSINRSMGREESAYGQPSALGASAGRGPGSRAPSRKASRPSGFDPSCDHESLAGDTCLRVPPSFHSGVAITVPSAGAFLTGPASRRGSRVGAMLTLLRLPLSSACASLRHHLADHPLEERKQRSS